MKFLLFTFIVSFVFYSAQANDIIQESKAKSNIRIDSSKKEIILIGNITFGHQAKDISIMKAEAAFHLACVLSQKYINIPLTYSDSLANLLKHKDIKLQIETVADSLKADQIAFIHIDRFENILRTEISIVKTNDVKNVSTGDGYALLHYIKSGNQPLLDPTLLQSTQRAFAVAEEDSMMYVKLDGDLKVVPAKTLVIGGLEYKIGTNLFPKWQIFDNKVLTSYDAVETIFQEAKNSMNYVTFDVPTRDSIYALFNFYYVENDHSASPLEIEALDKFDVDNYLSGEIKKLKKGAEITLNLYNIQSKQLKKIKSVNALLEKDDIDEFRKVLSDLVKKLIE